jgi:phosphotransferase system HPr-like phosphotransfer protein
MEETVLRTSGLSGNDAVSFAKIALPEPSTVISQPECAYDGCKKWRDSKEVWYNPTSGERNLFLEKFNKGTHALSHGTCLDCTLGAFQDIGLSRADALAEIGKFEKTHSRNYAVLRYDGGYVTTDVQVGLLHGLAEREAHLISGECARYSNNILIERIGHNLSGERASLKDANALIGLRVGKDSRLRIMVEDVDKGTTSEAITRGVYGMLKSDVR